MLRLATNKERSKAWAVEKNICELGSEYHWCKVRQRKNIDTKHIIFMHMLFCAFPANTCRVFPWRGRVDTYQGVFYFLPMSKIITESISIGL